MVISIMVQEKHEFENCHMQYSRSTLSNNFSSIICSLGEELVKITKEAFRDKFQIKF